MELREESQCVPFVGSRAFAAAEGEAGLKVVLRRERHHRGVSSALRTVDLVEEGGASELRQWKDIVGSHELPDRSVVHNVSMRVDDVALAVSPMRLFTEACIERKHYSMGLVIHPEH